LYLVSHNMLAKPSLYLSDFFERTRASYYDALMQVRVGNDITQWARFFLNGLSQTATKGRDVFQQILSLRIWAKPSRYRRPPRTGSLTLWLSSVF
jgi:Fic family protein